jgi:hypothetical protein
MSYIPEPAKIYPAGTILTAKTNPDVKLEIVRYYHRIYYCSVVEDPTHRQVVYFNNELTLPV